MSDYLALVLIIELATVLVSRPVSHHLRAVFSVPAPSNALWFAMAYAAFCACIALVRRLPHGAHMFKAEVTLKTMDGWAQFSVALGPMALIMAAATVVGPANSFLPPGFVFDTLKQIGAFVFFGLVGFPVFLLRHGTPALLHPSRQAIGESAVLALSAFTVLVTKSFYEWALLDRAGARVGALSLTHPLTWIGVALIVPIFLAMFGGPRLLLLARRFSKVEAVILVVSTALYFLSGFAF